MINGYESTRTCSLYDIYFSKLGEWFFAFFLFAGYYKADPRIAFIQSRIDITVFFLILSFVVFVYRALVMPYTLLLPRRFAKVTVFFLLLVACIIGSLFYSESAQYGYEKALRFAILTGWAFFGAGFLISDLSSLKRFSWAILTISTMMGIDAIASFPGIGHFGFIRALGSNYIALARASGLGLLILVTFLLPIEQRPLWKLLLCGLWTLQLWATMSAGARGPVMALILSLALFIALSIRNFPRIRIERYALRFGIIALCIIIVFSFIWQSLFPTLAFRTRILFGEVGASAMERYSLNLEAINLWKQSPIWGLGVGAFSPAVEGADVRSYPHNMIMELGAETGLVGVLIFIAMVWVAIAKPLLTLRTQSGLAKTATRYLLVICCFALINSMVSGDINDNRFLFASIGLIAAVNRFQKSRKESNLSS